MISDFVCPDFSDALRIAGHKHDLLALDIYDPREMDFPDVGLVEMQDAESGVTRLVDTSSKAVRESIKQNAIARMQTNLNIFKRAGVDSAFIADCDDYVKPLIKLFKSR